MNDLAWTVLSAGADQSLMYIDGGIPAWLDKGDNGSLLSVAGGALSWLPKGGDQALLHIDGDTPAWFECGGPDEAMLVYVAVLVSQGKRPGAVHINGDAPAWFDANSGNAVLTTAGGNLSWKGSVWHTYEDVA